MNLVYQSLFEAAPHACVALRADPDFEVLFVNARFLALTGARRENIVGRKLFDILPNLAGDPSREEPDLFRASLERVLRHGAPDDMGLRERRGPDGPGGVEIRGWRRVNIPVPDGSGRIALILSHVEPVAVSAPGEAKAADSAATVARVVIVAADAGQRADLGRLLADEGFDTALASGVEDGHAACLAASPALFLICASGELDASELARRLRAGEGASASPIMILSPRVGEAERIEAYEAGADALVERPVGAGELVARIHSIVRLAGARDRLAGRERRVAVLARLASVVETAMDAVISIDSDQNITLFNAAAEKMFGCDSRSALGRPLDDFIPARYRASHADHVRAFAKTGVSGRTMGRLGDLTGLRANGEEFPIEASISQARVDGEVLFTVILRDLTERHAAAETQRLLIGELDHRVKNTLALVQAIARQTAKVHVDPKAFVASFNGRVHAMASAHTLLTQAGWKGADFGSLIEEQLTLGADPRIVCDGPDLFLPPQFALHFGMVLYELGSNARKYGALSSETGRLELRWRVEDADGAVLLEFYWQEAGGPPVEAKVEKNFGTRLIESSLTHSLHGQVELDFAPSGLRCRIRVPLRQGEL